MAGDLLSRMKAAWFFKHGAVAAVKMALGSGALPSCKPNTSAIKNAGPFQSPVLGISITVPATSKEVVNFIMESGKAQTHTLTLTAKMLDTALGVNSKNKFDLFTETIVKALGERLENVVRPPTKVQRKRPALSNSDFYPIAFEFFVKACIPAFKAEVELLSGIGRQNTLAAVLSADL